MGALFGPSRLTRTCSASPQTVYSLLADLPSHLEWGGRKQWPGFRLLSMEAPEGPAAIGTTFTSTGSIAGSLRRWTDRSQVTVANPTSVFEFVTEGTIHRGRRTMESRFVHRYDIAPAPGGSRITYTLTLERLVRPVLRLRLPVQRTITWRVGIPLFVRHGLRGLARAAADREAEKRSAAAVAR